MHTRTHTHTLSLSHTHIHTHTHTHVPLVGENARVSHLPCLGVPNYCAHTHAMKYMDTHKHTHTHTDVLAIPLFAAGFSKSIGNNIRSNLMGWKRVARSLTF